MRLRVLSALLVYSMLATASPIPAQETTTDPAPQGEPQGDVEVDSSVLLELLETLLIEKGIDIIENNVKAAERESGDLDKAIRAVLGVSVKDIREHGLLGGPNSEMRKLFKALGLDD